MARWFRDRDARHGIPSVSLRRLLHDATFVGCRDLDVSGCSTDGSRIEPGEVYVITDSARPGDLETALSRGAVGIIAEREVAGAGPIQTIVADSRRAYAQLCQALAGEPARKLDVIAIVGPSGRCGTSLYLRSMMDRAGRRYGWVGRLGWSDGVRTFPPCEAELDARALTTMLAEMLERGCEGAFVELSLTGLLRGLDETMPALGGVVIMGGMGPVLGNGPGPVRRAFKRLMRRTRPGGTIVLNDEPESALLCAMNLDAGLMTYGPKPTAQVQGLIESVARTGARVRMRGPWGERLATVAASGRRHVESALAASALAWSQRIAVDSILEGIGDVGYVPGRLEPIMAGSPAGPMVWLEDVSAPLELAPALRDARALTRGTLHVVLDSPLAALEGLELARVGEPRCDRLVVVRDERDWAPAIEAALSGARPEDGIVIVGRGRCWIDRSQGRPRVRNDRSLVESILNEVNSPGRRRSA